MSQTRPRPAAPVTAVLSGRGPTRVLIVDNHPLVTESLRLLLDGQGDMQVVGQAASVAEAGALDLDLAPEVAVLDFHLDDGTGRDAAIVLRQMYPDVRFVFLSRDESDGARLAAIEGGVSAYLPKSAPASQLITTIREVALGASFITPVMIARLVATGRHRELMRNSLSSREKEVLQLMADGIGTRQIADQLGISYSTVRSHVRSISAKLGARSMVNAVVAARELELVN